MELTRKEALRLHKQMWSNMKKDLGDTPDFLSRTLYKQRWCKKHGFEDVKGCCFLCEYADNVGESCKYCPIEWPNGDCCYGDVSYCYSPISKILELPERDILPFDI